MQIKNGPTCRAVGNDSGTKSDRSTAVGVRRWLGVVADADVAAVVAAAVAA